MLISRGRFLKKPLKTNEKSIFFWFSGVEVGAKNRPGIDRTWTPRRDASFCDPKRVQDAPQDVPKRPQDAPRRARDAPRCRKTLPRCRQDAPRRAQDAPRRPQDGPKRRARRPKTPQDGGKIGSQQRSEAQSPPDLDFGPFWGGFWTVLGRILDRFGEDFGTFLG